MPSILRGLMGLWRCTLRGSSAKAEVLQSNRTVALAVARRSKTLRHGLLYELTDPRQFFAEPATPRQRQYEALRAFVERLASAEAARRFGYSPGAFRVLCHTFRRGELPDFFTTAHPGPREQPKKERRPEANRDAAQAQLFGL